MSNVRSMTGMFQNALFNQDISSWCVRKITDEPELFSTDSPLSEEFKPVWGSCNGLPETIKLTNPIKGGNNIGKLTYFSWDADSVASLYQLVVETAFGPAITVLDTLIHSRNFQLATELAANTRYDWRGRGINSGKNLSGEWSQTWYFTTGIRTNIEPLHIKNKYTLSQNYPNPFNPSTQIQFTLAEASYVTIQIFNSLGHQVMELLNEQKPAGMHELVLDGSQLSSGLYYYTLRTPSYSETKKMLLVK